MKQKIKGFFDSDLYLILIALLTITFWVFKINYYVSLSIITVIVLLITLTSNESKAFVPLFLFATCGDLLTNERINDPNSMNYNNVTLIFITILALINLGCLIYFFIKNRRKGNHGNSLLNISLLVIGGAFLLTDLFIRPAFNFAFFIIIALIIYIIKMTTDEENFKTSFLPYLAKTLFYFGLVISFQITYQLINESLKQKDIVEPCLGWAISNNASLILLLIMPIANYLYYKEKHFGYVLGLIIMMLANLFTLSRGGVLAMVVVLIPLLLVINYCYMPSKKRYFLFLILTILSLTLIWLIFGDFFQEIIAYLQKDGTSDSGRKELYKEAIRIFKESPLLGGGSILILWKESPKQWFHSTFFDIIGQLGIVGLVAFGYHFFVKYKTIFTNRSQYKWFVLIGFLASGFYALMDVAYFQISYLVFYCLILTSLELPSKEDTKKSS